MNGSGAFGDLVTDLLKWVSQNETPEGGWYRDEGPLAADAMPAADSLQTAPVKPIPAVNPTISPAEDPFAAECREFVTRAMTEIAGQAREHGRVAERQAVPPAADPAQALAALRDEVLPCTACGLHQTRHHVVFGSGSPTADLVIVGEAPGRDEDLQGEPFVGRSGKLLTRILAAIGLAREDVFICNILKCRPPQNRDPLPPEVASCEPHLQRQLAIIRPVVICCLGRVAAQTLLKTPVSLGKLRGGVHFYQDIPVLATYHPAYLLRNPEAKRDTWNDVRKLRALLDCLKSESTGGRADNA